MKIPTQSSNVVEKVSNDSNATHTRPKECYKCGGRGHFTVVCPTHEQKLTFACEDQSGATSVQIELTSNVGEEEVYTKEGLKAPNCLFV